jgi:ribosomal protein S27AE
MNNAALECTRCLNTFMASTMKERWVGEKL